MGYDFSQLDVLVVERHMLMRTLLEGVLREFGIKKTRVFYALAPALKSFQEKPSDIVLTDWSPLLDGLDLIDALRNPTRSGNPFVPIVVVSAFTERSHVLKARDRGMTEFLAKPVSARLIYRRIVSLIERPRPFVRGDSYFGPDRRRRAAPPPKGLVERRSSPFAC